MLTARRGRNFFLAVMDVLRIRYIDYRISVRDIGPSFSRNIRNERNGHIEKLLSRLHARPTVGWTGAVPCLALPRGTVPCYAQEKNVAVPVGASEQIELC
ncbi:hypothetical protein EVAR_41470_1 [Eumeta japonica]|uniref:Uncharacterized protein n=1 Tax=Eumeta variegata TaxID=151549 RepID=A0A4C1X3B0_EUMVA|nr:hypothetical protein EVAR_41470_1 [Eumeta japonica]